MKAIVRFHYGKKFYEIGDDVPEEVIKKYPQLVGVVYENEKKEVVEEQKMEYKFSATQKKKR